MDAGRFDKITTLFASRRLSRREAVHYGAAGLAAAGMTAVGQNATAAQDSTPAADGPLEKTQFLFLQSFRSGSIAAKEDGDGEYTVTLEHGLGQTVYFSNRPERIVGAMPTVKFLDALGFSPENPPNAALVVGTDDGEVDIAVLQLMNPAYDEETFTATYDVKVLENYSNVDMEFHETPADLEAIATPFGSAHLFIDDCADMEVHCRHWNANGYVMTEFAPSLGIRGTCWSWEDLHCNPCFSESLRDECYRLYPTYCNNSTPCWPWG